MHYTYFDFTDKLNINQRAKLIKEENFKGVFLFYSEDIDEVAKVVRSEGLDIETIHLPFENCNHLWLETPLGEEYIERTKKGILAAARNKINTVIFHISSKNNPPIYNELGINRIRDILDLAQEVDVNFAVENLRRLDYLDYIFEKLDSPKLKFCFDSGHANAFTKNIETFEFEKYKDKLICVHLHDNDESHDSHLTPFKGNIDWIKLASNLRKINYKGPLTSEAILKGDIDARSGLQDIKEALEKIDKYINE